MAQKDRFYSPGALLMPPMYVCSQTPLPPNMMWFLLFIPGPATSLSQSSHSVVAGSTLRIS
jgi:hypothetical protein